MYSAVPTCHLHELSGYLRGVPRAVSLVGRLDAEPGKADCNAEDGERRGDVRAPHTVVGKRADQEEEYGLQGKRQAVGDQDNRVDCSVKAGFAAGR